MERNAFILFLSINGCYVVRADKKGYCIVRNVYNTKMSGIPKNDPLKWATVCMICKNLEIKPPPDTPDDMVEFMSAVHRHAEMLKTILSPPAKS